ncbi:hypothetical protein KW796_02195 [Candidatus Parcubacteria bacterium]|nr:hypothetical protein [Candidatus Parcubacteria bacterium]
MNSEFRASIPGAQYLQSRWLMPRQGEDVDTTQVANELTSENFFQLGRDLVIRVRVDRLVNLREVETRTTILMFDMAADEHTNDLVGVIGYEHREPERDYLPLIFDRNLGALKGDAREEINRYIEEWQRFEHPLWLARRSMVAVEVENGLGYEMDPRSALLDMHYARMHGAIGAMLRSGDKLSSTEKLFKEPWMACHIYYHLGRMLSSRYFPDRERRKNGQEPAAMKPVRKFGDILGARIL